MPPTDAIRWGTERRLQFIEFRIFWEGGVRRADLIQTFGVSTPQASADLGLYQDLAPGNMVYDGSQKMYVATDGFKAKFTDVSAERYLAFLKDSAGEHLNLADGWMSQIPAAEVMPIPKRRIQPIVLKRIVAAVRNAQSVEVHYRRLITDLMVQGAGTPSTPGTPVTQTPELTLSAHSIDFGSVATNTTATRQILATNSGDGPLSWTAAPAISGNAAF